MYKLGPAFLIQYYKILLNEKHSLVVIAENDGRVCGFHSGTAKAEEHQQAILKNKFRLALALIPQILSHPKLSGEILRRFAAMRTEDPPYRITEGPRGEYWAWLPSQKDPAGSLMVLEKWHSIMKASGVPGIKFEVDLCNNRVLGSIEYLKARVLKEIVLPDGRKRRFLEIRYEGKPAEEFSLFANKLDT
jgi:hypothetical protein